MYLSLHRTWSISSCMILGLIGSWMFVTKGFSLVTQTVEKHLPSLQEKQPNHGGWLPGGGAGPRPTTMFSMGTYICLQFQKW